MSAFLTCVAGRSRSRWSKLPRRTGHLRNTGRGPRTGDSCVRRGRTILDVGVLRPGPGARERCGAPVLRFSLREFFFFFLFMSTRSRNSHPGKQIQPLTRYCAFPWIILFKARPSRTSAFPFARRVGAHCIETSIFYDFGIYTVRDESRGGSKYP